MDFGGFVVQGSRPPSVESSFRPKSGRSKNGYHTVSYQASVDETLFSAHHPTKVHEPLTDFKAPWEYPKPTPLGRTFAESAKLKLRENREKSKPKGRPLLWAPMPGTVTHSYKKKEDKNSTSQSSMNSMSQFWNSRDHCKTFKHTPTFVDESLFGSKLKEPSFEAPWNEKSKVHNGFHIDFQHRKCLSKYQRPKTALGIQGEKNKAVPVWKP